MSLATDGSIRNRPATVGGKRTIEKTGFEDVGIYEHSTVVTPSDVITESKVKQETARLDKQKKTELKLLKKQKIEERRTRESAVKKEKIAAKIAVAEAEHKKRNKDQEAQIAEKEEDEKNGVDDSDNTIDNVALDHTHGKKVSTTPQ